jgi:hypothetical protein
MNMFARFAQDESGATAIEYGLIALGSLSVSFSQQPPAAAASATSSMVSPTS